MPAVRRHRRRTAATELAVVVVVAAVITVLLRALVLQVYYIPSGSMEPTLQPGDRILVEKVTRHLGDIERGDIVVFPDPSAQDPNGAATRAPTVVKRVIGLPGERVEVADDGTVRVDGARLQEPYHDPAPSLPWEARTVPEGKLFVLGDNRQASADSRGEMGYVAVDDVEGHARVVLLPAARASTLP